MDETPPVLEKLKIVRRVRSALTLVVFILLVFCTSISVSAEETQSEDSLEESDTAILSEVNTSTLEIVEEVETMQLEEDTSLSDEPMEYTQKDLSLLATLIYAEAGSCDEMEKLRVGNVVLNRVKDNSKEFKNTLREVIYQKGQFESVDGRAWNRGPTQREMEIAYQLLNGKRVLPDSVVWFSKKCKFGELYYKSEWHEFSGWSQQAEGEISPSALIF